MKSKVCGKGGGHLLSDHVSPNVLAVNKRKSILQYASTTSTHHPKNNSFTLFFPTLSSSKSWVNAPVCACPPSVDTTLDHDAHIAVDNNLSLQLLDLLFFGSVCWASIDHWFLPLHSSFYTLILQRWPRQVGSRQVIFAYRPLSFIIGSNMGLYDSIDSRSIVRPGNGSLEELQISKCG